MKNFFANHIFILIVFLILAIQQISHRDVIVPTLIRYMGGGGNYLDMEGRGILD